MNDASERSRAADDEPGEQPERPPVDARAREAQQLFER
ncbi:MAG: hypothetical protein QOD76_2196, partial [Solirubrobacteraceae bacterium]|nr:hypothetical protein [Solirubrobacteraceae bacterium]